MSCAFIGKILFTDSATIQSDPFTKFLTLTLIQFWQYGTLYIYLFWLNIQNIPKLTLNYAQATKMSFVEKVKDIILPACRNLAVLLFILNFIFSIFEDAKIQFIFKSSIGTHTELLSQWLNRTYQSDSLINLGFSNERITQLSFFVLALTFISTIISALIFLFFYKNFVKTKTILRIRRGSINPVIIYIALALFIIVPIFYAVFSTVKDFNFVFGHLLSPFLFTIITALLSVFLSMLLGIILRLGWKETLSSFNNRSLFFYIFLFILMLVPPILVYITGFQWLKIIGYQSILMLQIVWIIGHLILILPLLTSFITVSHFKTTNNEIDYLEAHKISLIQVIKDTFLKRYLSEYIFTFLIAFSLIWNEPVINNLLSDFIGSFVSEMRMNVEGRAADYAKGMNYLFVAFAIAIFAIWLWRIILNKLTRRENEVY